VKVSWDFAPKLQTDTLTSFTCQMYPALLVAGVNFESIMSYAKELIRYCRGNSQFAARLSEPLKKTRIQSVKTEGTAICLGPKPKIVRLASQSYTWKAGWDIADEIEDKNAKLEGAEQNDDDFDEIEDSGDDEADSVQPGAKDGEIQEMLVQNAAAASTRGAAKPQEVAKPKEQSKPKEAAKPKEAELAMQKRQPKAAKQADSVRKDPTEVLHKSFENLTLNN
jgi:hypothetical protein